MTALFAYLFDRDGTWDAQRSSERRAEHPALAAHQPREVVLPEAQVRVVDL
jgi:hypothetical protein